ncbi:unnamed protein product, partial [Prorocentrum cordatum]
QELIWAGLSVRSEGPARAARGPSAGTDNAGDPVSMSSGTKPAATDGRSRTRWSPAPMVGGRKDTDTCCPRTSLGVRSDQNFEANPAVTTRIPQEDQERPKTKGDNTYPYLCLPRHGRTWEGAAAQSCGGCARAAATAPPSRAALARTSESSASLVGTGGIPARAGPDLVDSGSLVRDDASVVADGSESHTSPRSTDGPLDCSLISYAMSPALWLNFRRLRRARESYSCRGRRKDRTSEESSPARTGEQPAPRVQTACLLARADLNVEDVAVWLQIRFAHLAEQRECPLPLLALLARADPDPNIVAVTSGSSFASHISLSSAKSPLPLLALLARADSSIVTMTSGSTFASSISLSSARAGCHCSPFSHALMPAL